MFHIMRARREKAAMEYWCFEDDPTEVVCVHVEVCRCCNGGKGIKPHRMPNCRWLGPHHSYGAAMVVAVRTGKSNVRPCLICHPEGKR